MLSLLAACQNGGGAEDSADSACSLDERGRAVYNALRCGSLLCNWRRGAAAWEAENLERSSGKLVTTGTSIY